MTETDILDLVALRLRQLVAEERRLRWKLRFYQGFSDIAVLVGIVVPVLAGSSLLQGADFSWFSQKRIGIAVLVAALFTAIHKGLGCEAYHERCRHAIHALRSLTEGFQAVAARDLAHRQGALDELDRRLRQYREHAFDLPAKQPSPVSG